MKEQGVNGAFLKGKIMKLKMNFTPVKLKLYNEILGFIKGCLVLFLF